MSDVLAVNAVNLTRTYGSLTAVDNVTVQVAQGEVNGVFGPNGAGKTTFLRMLFGLIRPAGWRWTGTGCCGRRGRQRRTPSRRSCWPCATPPALLRYLGLGRVDTPPVVREIIRKTEPDCH